MTEIISNLSPEFLKLQKEKHNINRNKKQIEMEIVKLEKEMSQVQRKYKDAEANYGSDLLNLVVARGYLSKLISTPTVKDYLTQNHPDILDTFELVVNTVSMDEAVSAEDQDPSTDSGDVVAEDDDLSDEPSDDQ